MEKQENSKKWPSWLKGGIIFASVDLIILVLWLLYNRTFTDEASVFIFFFTQPIIFWFTGLYDNFHLLQTSLVIIEGLLGYFIIGAAVGFVYGKIKQKIIRSKIK